jgi:NB-ARC domain
MRVGRFTVMAAAAAVAALATTVGGVAVNAATGSKVPWFPSMDDHYLWWLAGSTVAVWWAQRRYEQALAAVVPAEQRLPEWVVDRPAEVGQVVRALRRRQGATAGITTVVHGAGGFGKTTLARLVRSDRRVLRWFGRRVYWVTLGRDVRHDALLGKIVDLIGRVDPDRERPFTDVRQAADHLAAVLADGPRRLVIVDDVVRRSVGSVSGGWSVCPAGDHPGSVTGDRARRASAGRRDVRHAGAAGPNR